MKLKIVDVEGNILFNNSIKVSFCRTYDKNRLRHNVSFNIEDISEENKFKLDKLVNQNVRFIYMDDCEILRSPLRFKKDIQCFISKKENIYRINITFEEVD